jgi:hypothetical protein
MLKLLLTLCLLGLPAGQINAQSQTGRTTETTADQRVAETELKPSPEVNLLLKFRETPDDPQFAGLKQAQIRSPRQAEVAAITWLSREHGLLAEEKVRVAGLFRASRRTQSFEEPNWIWEVRVTELVSALAAVLLIDAQTGQVFGAVPTAQVPE